MGVCDDAPTAHFRAPKTGDRRFDMGAPAGRLSGLIQNCGKISATWVDTFVREKKLLATWHYT